jgi:hypothetical protein
MQKVRALGESFPGYSQAGTAEEELLNITQMDSPSGQLDSVQFARVQYPPGCEVSQIRCRSPEQS